MNRNKRSVIWSAVAVVQVLFLSLWSAALFAQQSAPDLILLNGKIFTSDIANPYVQALAIRGERIIATGASEKILALAGTETRRIDLGGRTVIPGINDAHNHLEVSPSEIVELQFKTLNPRWNEVKQALAAGVVK